MSSSTQLAQSDVTAGDTEGLDLGIGDEDETLPLDADIEEGVGDNEGGLIDEKLHYHVDEMTVAFRHSRDIEKKFVKAHKRSERLQSTPNFQEQMVLYSLYQHSVFGDPPAVDDPEFSDVFGAQKRAAWVKLKGRTKEQAMKGYISYVEELGNKYGWLLEGEKVGDSLFDDALLHSAF